MQPSEGAPRRGAGIVAWGGTALFVASLGYFFFSYVARFEQPAPETARGAAIAVNVALFTLFALHHSVFARERVRAAVARAVPRRLERAVYVWVASALFIAVCALWQPVAGLAWEATGPLRWLLIAVQGMGILLVLSSAAVIDVLELSGVRQAARPGATAFKASGPYGWMRHPIYTGWMLIVFCAPTMTMTRFVFALVSSVYLLVAIPFEERSLAATSAGAYERYARAVRWRLIPGLY
ncbi:MAG: methyltransferase family protein [Vicinamibacterales bacterium]